jgi:glucose-6-phosphate-specific signal transduction histidine kinase
MKKIFVLSMLVSFVMICSCQKKESAAEEQLTQPKTELGGREEKLAERLNSLEEKVNRLDQSVKELAEKQKTTINARTSPTDVQDRTSDPAQIQAENERMIQQFSTMISHARQMTAGDPAKQERPGQRQLGPEDLQRQWQDKTKMSGKAVLPAAEAASPTPSSTPE